MSHDETPFGARLIDALRELGGFALITSRLDYDGIQNLKAADRAQTVKMFYGSSYEALQKIKTEEPEAVAKYLVEAIANANRNASAIVLMIY